LNYHKPGAPVREFHPQEKKPRQLIWARLLLIAGLHRFYLWQPWKGIFFIFALLVASSFSVSWTAIAQNESSLIQLLISIFPLVALYAIEYFRLPRLVRDANVKAFGVRAKTAPEMQGLIGDYASLRPIVLCIIATYIFAIIASNLSWPSWMLNVAGIAYLIAFIVFLVQLHKIMKRQNLEHNHD